MGPEIAVLVDNIVIASSSHSAEIAQLVEHFPEEEGVAGSNPALGTTFSKNHKNQKVMSGSAQALQVLEREISNEQTSLKRVEQAHARKMHELETLNREIAELDREKTDVQRNIDRSRGELKRITRELEDIAKKR